MRWRKSSLRDLRSTSTSITFFFASSDKSHANYFYNNILNYANYFHIEIILLFISTTEGESHWNLWILCNDERTDVFIHTLCNNAWSLYMCLAERRTNLFLRTGCSCAVSSFRINTAIPANGDRQNENERDKHRSNKISNSMLFDLLLQSRNIIVVGGGRIFVSISSFNTRPIRFYHKNTQLILIHRIIRILTQKTDHNIMRKSALFFSFHLLFANKTDNLFVYLLFSSLYPCSLNKQ